MSRQLSSGPEGFALDDHVRTLDPILRSALDALPDFEHDLIVMAYGFRPEGFSYRAEPNFDSYSPAELEERLRQARAMFAKNLRELLQKTEQTHAAQEILALLRGET